MKNLLFPLLAIISSAILFTGCKDDEESDGKKTEQTTNVSESKSWHDLCKENSWLGNFPQPGSGCHNVSIADYTGISNVRVEVYGEGDKMIADYEKALESSGFNASFAPHGKIIGPYKYYVDIAFIGNGLSFSFYKVTDK
ncbi:MAG: hypothetical protein MJZ00_08150 [Paludibacteraceae bacterium]|nr:hypothetical protein [Paludibacteraceae bacterium]